MPGVYQWIASYDGDLRTRSASRAPAATRASPRRSNQDQPTLSTEQSWIPQDSATIVAPGGRRAEGTAHFALYESADCYRHRRVQRDVACRRPRRRRPSAPATPGPATAATPPTASGTTEYSWQVSYDQRQRRPGGHRRDVCRGQHADHRQRQHRPDQGGRDEGPGIAGALITCGFGASGCDVEALRGRACRCGARSSSSCRGGRCSQLRRSSTGRTGGGSRSTRATRGRSRRTRSDERAALVAVELDGRRVGGGRRHVEGHGVALVDRRCPLRRPGRTVTEDEPDESPADGLPPPPLAADAVGAAATATTSTGSARASTAVTRRDRGGFRCRGRLDRVEGIGGSFVVMRLNLTP